MSIESNIALLRNKLLAKRCQLLVVSKNQPPEKIQTAYDAGQRVFGENKVQELMKKWEVMPKDIEWHMIGHLQTNKIKYIAPFVSLIHTVDSYKLLAEINKQGSKINRIIYCLLQIKIAQEESKYGMQCEEATTLLETISNYPFVRIKGLMGMATFTDSEPQIKKDFGQLQQFYLLSKNKNYGSQVELNELSMGMSADYTLALEMGSTLVRIGSAVFK